AFSANVSKETLLRSTLGNLKADAAVNLECAVTPATRLGGHIVQGHVDARGKFLGSEDHGESWTFRFAYPKEIARYLVFKGSVTAQFQSEHPFPLVENEKHNPRSHTKPREEGSCLVTLRVISWNVTRRRNKRTSK